MDSASEPVAQELVELTSEIVSAYVSNNKIPSSELSEVIVSVHAALKGLEEKKTAEPERPVPSIPIKKTITPDYLISLEDGKQYKSLKRHLSGRGLTPAEYREKWGLAKDYPMVAPNYAKQRSELAKALGLGQQRRKSIQANEPDIEMPPVETPQAPKRRGRPKSVATA